jgi:YgiT-type zinc finger domain-containing protein
MHMKTCYYCGGALEDSLTTLNRHKHGEHFIFEDVPSRTCSQCREHFYDSRVLEQIDELMKEKVKADRTITVPVFKFKVA